MTGAWQGLSLNMAVIVRCTALFDSAAYLGLQKGMPEARPVALGLLSLLLACETFQ